MVAVTLSVAGSIFMTVRSSELATHTAAGVIAMPAGPEPTGSWAARLAGGRVDPGNGAVFTIRHPDGVRPDRDGVWPPADLDRFRHRAGRGVDLVHGVVAFVGYPHATWPAGDGDRDVADRVVCTTGLDAALIRDTVPSPLLATHTFSPVTATALGAEPTGICWTTAWVAGLIRDSLPSVLSTAQTEPSP